MASWQQNVLPHALCSPQKQAAAVMNWPPVAVYQHTVQSNVRLWRANSGAGIWNREDKKWRVIFLSACQTIPLAEVWEAVWQRTYIGRKFVLYITVRYWLCAVYADINAVLFSSWKKLSSLYRFNICQIASRALLEKLIVAQLPRKFEGSEFWSIQYTTWIPVYLRHWHYVGVIIDGVLDWMIGFIGTLYIHNSGLQTIQRYR
jgi:hypothetical protein